jgi:hypothetical protein
MSNQPEEEDRRTPFEKMDDLTFFLQFFDGDSEEIGLSDSSRHPMYFCLKRQSEAAFFAFDDRADFKFLTLVVSNGSVSDNEVLSSGLVAAVHALNYRGPLRAVDLESSPPHGGRVKTRILSALAALAAFLTMLGGLNFRESSTCCRPGWFI